MSHVPPLHLLSVVTLAQQVTRKYSPFVIQEYKRGTERWHELNEH